MKHVHPRSALLMLATALLLTLASACTHVGWHGTHGHGGGWWAPGITVVPACSPPAAGRGQLTGVHEPAP